MFSLKNFVKYEKKYPEKINATKDKINYYNSKDI